MNTFRRLAYRSDLRRLARFLHLTEILKKCYYRWVVSSESVFRTRVEGIDCRFYAHSPAELQGIETSFMGLLSEKDFLEALIANLRPGDVFYNVGSHVGKFTIPISKVVGEKGQVIAFEPEPGFYNRLLANLELNALSNVRVFKKALGDENCPGRLFVGGSACPSLLAHEGNAEQQSASEDVDIVQGDWVVRTEGLPIPRAVKIDVEGYEFSVLRGLEHTLAHPACELLCCEIHSPSEVFTSLPPGVTLQMIVEFVKSAGFSHLCLRPRGDQIHMIARKGATERAAS